MDMKTVEKLELFIKHRINNLYIFILNNIIFELIILNKTKINGH